MKLQIQIQITLVYTLQIILARGYFSMEAKLQCIQCCYYAPDMCAITLKYFCHMLFLNSLVEIRYLSPLDHMICH